MALCVFCAIIDSASGIFYIVDRFHRRDALKKRPLFVPLTKEAFDDFLWGKLWEVRRAKRQWNKKQLFHGRRVVVSCGYSGPRLFGKIEMVLFGSLKHIFKKAIFKEIEPRAKSRKAAIKMEVETLGPAKEYAAFKISLEESGAAIETLKHGRVYKL